MDNDIEYGLEIEEVFKRFNERVDLAEVKYITTSLTILNKTGGNIIDVFSSIEKMNILGIINKSFNPFFINFV